MNFNIFFHQQLQFYVPRIHQNMHILFKLKFPSTLIELKNNKRNKIQHNIHCRHLPLQTPTQVKFHTSVLQSVLQTTSSVQSVINRWAHKHNQTLTRKHTVHQPDASPEMKTRASLGKLTATRFGAKSCNLQNSQLCIHQRTVVKLPARVNNAIWQIVKLLCADCEEASTSLMIIILSQLTHH